MRLEKLAAGASSVEMVLEYRSPKRMQKLAQQAGPELRIVDEHSAYLRLGVNETGQEMLYNRLRRLLAPASDVVDH